MIKTTDKEIREAVKRGEMNNMEKPAEDLLQWQTKHGSTGVPTWNELGYKKIAYSAGVYGSSGGVLIDEDGEIYGWAGRQVYTYM